jgi:hypothetical protein
MATGNYLGQRYSTPIVIPDSSQIDDKRTNDEMNYVLNALRTMALQMDALTGALSPLASNWSTVSALNSILGNNTNKFYALCLTDIAYGAMVNFTNKDATTVYARTAQASSASRGAQGFCVTPGGFVAGSYGEFVVGTGVNYGLNSLTPGTVYYLDPTSTLGQVNSSAPVTAGQIKQVIGVAITNTQLLVQGLGNWTQL